MLKKEASPGPEASPTPGSCGSKPSVPKLDLTPLLAKQEDTSVKEVYAEAAQEAEAEEGGCVVGGVLGRWGEEGLLSSEGKQCTGPRQLGNGVCLSVLCTMQAGQRCVLVRAVHHASWAEACACPTLLRCIQLAAAQSITPWVASPLGKVAHRPPLSSSPWHSSLLSDVQLTASRPSLPAAMQRRSTIRRRLPRSHPRTTSTSIPRWTPM